MAGSHSPPPEAEGMDRVVWVGGGKHWTDTRARTDKRTCLNGSNSPQVNAKCDVVIKLSVFGTQTDTHTHTHGKTYTSSLCGL